jgi:hypothetical protein
MGRGPWGDGMFKDPDEVERAERDQDADCARIDAAIDAAERAITALETRGHGPDERRKELSAIRDRTILSIRDVRHNIITRANKAQQTERWMVQKWLREVNDGRILNELTADLQKMPTRGLLDYLRYLIEFNELARIQSVNAVFAARADNRRYAAAFEKMLAQFTLSKCGVLGARIAKIYQSAESIDAKIVQVLSAQCMVKRLSAPASQPLARMQAPVIAPMDNHALPDYTTGEALLEID